MSAVKRSSYHDDDDTSSRKQVATEEMRSMAQLALAREGRLQALSWLCDDILGMVAFYIIGAHLSFKTMKTLLALGPPFSACLMSSEKFAEEMHFHMNGHRSHLIAKLMELSRACGSPQVRHALGARLFKVRQSTRWRHAAICSTMFHQSPVGGADLTDSEILALNVFINGPVEVLNAPQSEDPLKVLICYKAWDAITAAVGDYCVAVKPYHLKDLPLDAPESTLHAMCRHLDSAHLLNVLRACMHKLRLVEALCLTRLGDIDGDAVLARFALDLPVHVIDCARGLSHFMSNVETSIHITTRVCIAALRSDEKSEISDTMERGDIVFDRIELVQGLLSGPFADRAIHWLRQLTDPSDIAEATRHYTPCRDNPSSTIVHALERMPPDVRKRLIVHGRLLSAALVNAPLYLSAKDYSWFHERGAELGDMNDALVASLCSGRADLAYAISRDQRAASELSVEKVLKKVFYASRVDAHSTLTPILCPEYIQGRRLREMIADERRKCKGRLPPGLVVLLHQMEEYIDAEK